ncbi:MAG: hypothetical protein M3Y74_06820 [Chloroflexota bacterium]|nr:hypothetical protein [Chloroflexota bacterium]
MSQTEMEMAPFQADMLLPRLITDFGYSPRGAADIAGKLAASNPGIKRIFWSWWRTGHVDDTLMIEGYTAARIVGEYGVKPPAAFTTLDLLQKNPERALAALNRKHDRAVFRRPAAGA